ncbi:MAG TPA: hypothetical protein VL201_03045 [Patescibacteria group bacterium]|nr:hypothetical protein [Patescibacteria group bacterium]
MIIVWSIVFLAHFSLMAQEKNGFKFEQQLIATSVNLNNTLNDILKTHRNDPENSISEKITSFNRAFYDFQHVIVEAPAIQTSPFSQYFQYAFKSLAFPENFMVQSVDQRSNILKTMSLQRDWFFEAIAFTYGCQPVRNQLSNTYEYTEKMAWKPLNLKGYVTNQEVNELKNHTTNLAKQIENLLKIQEAQFDDPDDQDLTSDDPTTIQEAVNNVQKMVSIIKNIELFNEARKEIPYSRYAVLRLINNISNELDIFLNEYKNNSIIKNNPIITVHQRDKLKLCAADLKGISRRLTWQAFQRVATNFPLKDEDISEEFIESISELRTYNQETEPINEANRFTQWGNVVVNVVGNFCGGTIIKNKASHLMASIIPTWGSLFYTKIDDQIQEAKGINPQLFTRQGEKQAISGNMLTTFMTQGMDALAQNVVADAKITLNNKSSDALKEAEKMVKTQKNLYEIHMLPLEFFLKAMTFAFYTHCAEIDELKALATLPDNKRTLFTSIYLGKEPLSEDTAIISRHDPLLSASNQGQLEEIMSKEEKQENLLNITEEKQFGIVSFVPEAKDMPIDLPICNTNDQSYMTLITESSRSALSMLSTQSAFDILRNSIESLKNSGEGISNQWNSLYESLENGQKLIADIEELIKKEKNNLATSSLILEMPNKELRDLIMKDQNVAEILICTLPEAVLDYLDLLKEDEVAIKTLWEDPAFVNCLKQNIDNHMKTYKNGLEKLKAAVKDKSIGRFLIWFSRIEAGDEKLRVFIPLYRLIKSILQAFADCLNELLVFSEKGTIAVWNSVKVKAAQTIVQCMKLNNEKINTAQKLCDMLENTLVQ